MQWPFNVQLPWRCQIKQERRPNQVVKQLRFYIGWLQRYSTFVLFFWDTLYISPVQQAVFFHCKISLLHQENVIWNIPYDRTDLHHVLVSHLQESWRKSDLTFFSPNRMDPPNEWDESNHSNNMPPSPEQLMLNNQRETDKSKCEAACILALPWGLFMMSGWLYTPHPILHKLQDCSIC